MWALTSGRDHDDTDSRILLCVSVRRLCGDPPSAEERFHRLSVPRSHAVVDEDVEGGVDVGGDLQEPGRHEVGVLVATSRVQLWHEGQHQPARTQCNSTGISIIIIVIIIRMGAHLRFTTYDCKAIRFEID